MAIFPRPAKDDTRYTPERAEATYRILFPATLIRFVAEASQAWAQPAWLGWIVVAGGLGQVVELLLYFWTMWGRVRPVGSHIREAKGEKF